VPAKQTEIYGISDRKPIKGTIKHNASVSSSK
jgi:hypothetical protein